MLYWYACINFSLHIHSFNFRDSFYKSHEDKFFKDRTYLHLEYEDLNPFKIDREGMSSSSLNITVARGWDLVFY